MIEWLAKGDVTQVVLAVNHLSDKLRMEVAARNLGEKVALSVEESPLGTGGPLKLAEPMLTGGQPVVVVNGDVASDINLENLVDSHLKSGADATIALFEVSDPRRFGLVTLDSKDCIINFEEKSSSSNGPGSINAGVYVLHPRVLNMIPRGRAVSLEREIFPVLANQMKLHGWKHSGFWYDIGRVKDYVVANMELLERPEYRAIGSMAVPSPRIEQPSFISESCVVDRDARVGPRSILSPNVIVSKGARVRGSIVFEDTILGENCQIEGTVIGEGSKIGKRVTVGNGSVIAGEVTVPDDTVVNSGSMVLN
jgi:mannose-1-phosphate guanylyltransferase